MYSEDFCRNCQEETGSKNILKNKIKRNGQKLGDIHSKFESVSHGDSVKIITLSLIQI